MSPDGGRVAKLVHHTLAAHGTLVAEEEAALRAVPFRTRVLEAGEDVVSQGERPDVSVLVVSGMLARYHTLTDGDRQYLSLHLVGDFPDLQSLFLKVMDHSVCALGPAVIAVFPHADLRNLIVRRPGIAFAFWRLTLVDAAIFRQAVTNNSVRSHEARLAHLFAEIAYRAREAGLNTDNSCDLPLSQRQLGQALGMSHISVNRGLRKLRLARLADLQRGRLHILDWPGLADLAGFEPTYLHCDKEAAISLIPFEAGRD